MTLPIWLKRMHRQNRFGLLKLPLPAYLVIKRGVRGIKIKTVILKRNQVRKMLTIPKRKLSPKKALVVLMVGGVDVATAAKVGEKAEEDLTRTLLKPLVRNRPVMFAQI